MKRIRFSLFIISILFSYSFTDIKESKYVPKDTIYVSDEKSLLEYRKEINADLIAHRAYLENYYNKIGLGIAFVLTIFVALGYNTYRIANKAIEEKVQSDLNFKIDKSLKIHTEQIKTKIDNFQAEIDAKSVEINELRKDVSIIQEDIFENLDITEFHTPGLILKDCLHTLEYLNADGSQTKLSCSQSYDSETQEGISQVPASFGVEKPGRIIDVKSSAAEIMPIGKHTPNLRKYYIILPDLKVGDPTFTNETTVDFFNAYLGKEESYYLTRVHQSINDVFVLKCKRSRVPSDFRVERINSFTKQVDKIEIAPETSSDEENYIYTFTLPNDEPPVKYKIIWIFNS